jgi:hypothetical protein
MNPAFPQLLAATDTTGPAEAGHRDEHHRTAGPAGKPTSTRAGASGFGPGVAHPGVVGQGTSVSYFVDYSFQKNIASFLFQV